MWQQKDFMFETELMIILRDFCLKRDTGKRYRGSTVKLCLLLVDDGDRSLIGQTLKLNL